MASYRAGLAQLPPRTDRGKEREETGEDPPSDDKGEANIGPDDSERHEHEEVGEVESNDEGHAECAKARAVMNANIGACHVKLVSHSLLVPEFTQNLAAREITKRLSNHVQKVNAQVMARVI
jgi:hypothetical protein